MDNLIYPSISFKKQTIKEDLMKLLLTITDNKVQVLKVILKQFKLIKYQLLNKKFSNKFKFSYNKIICFDTSLVNNNNIILWMVFNKKIYILGTMNNETLISKYKPLNKFTPVFINKRFLNFKTDKFLISNLFIDKWLYTPSEYIKLLKNNKKIIPNDKISPSIIMNKQPVLKKQENKNDIFIPSKNIDLLFDYKYIYIFHTNPPTGFIQFKKILELIKERFLIFENLYIYLHKLKEPKNIIISFVINNIPTHNQKHFEQENILAHNIYYIISCCDSDIKNYIIEAELLILKYRLKYLYNNYRKTFKDIMEYIIEKNQLFSIKLNNNKKAIYKQMKKKLLEKMKENIEKFIEKTIQFMKKTTEVDNKLKKITNLIKQSLSFLNYEFIKEFIVKE